MLGRNRAEIVESGLDQPTPPATEGSSRRRLFDNVISLYALQGLNSFLPLLVLPYLVRTLGVENYGLLAFAQSLSQYFTIATDYGFNFSATRQLAQTRADASKVSEVFSAVFAVKTLLMVAGAVIFAIVISVFGRFRENELLYAVAYLTVVGNVLFPAWFFQGMERMRYVSVVTGISRMLSAVAVFIFVRSAQDVLIAIAVQSAGALLAGLLGLGIAIFDFKVSVKIPTVKQLMAVTKDGWHLFISTAAVTLYTNTNVFLVGLLGGNVQAGYFSAAEKMVRAMQGLVTPLMQAIFPHMNSLFSLSREAALQFVRKVLKAVGAVMFILSMSLFMLAPLAVTVCFGSGARDMVPVVRWIAFLPFLIGVSNILGIQTMITMGMDKQFSRILLIAGLLNIALAVPLIHMSGAQGAGTAVLVTELFVTVTMACVLQQKGISIIPLRGADCEN